MDPEGPPAPSSPAPGGPPPGRDRSPSRSGYWSGAHTTTRLRYHLVFAPKYRRRVLAGPLAARLEQLFRQCCEVNRWQLHELSVQPDHVHALVQLPPKVSVSDAVQVLKGGSGFVLRQEFPELEEFLWGAHFWAAGFFAESVGQTEEGVIRRYIREQGDSDGARGDGAGGP